MTHVVADLVINLFLDSTIPHEDLYSATYWGYKNESSDVVPTPKGLVVWREEGKTDANKHV